MTQFYTYLHCKPNGDPFYVGKGIKRRAVTFDGRTLHHKNIVAKYGKQNIGVFIFPCCSEKQSLEDEIHQIAQLRREGFSLINLTDGGDGSTGYKASEETRRNQSARQLGRKMPPRSDEQKRAASLSRIGKKLTPEQRDNQLLAASLRKRIDGAERPCVKCGTLFDKNTCPQCQKVNNIAYGIKNAAALKIKRKEWYDNNKDVRQGTQKKYYAANKEKIIAQSKKWAEENPKKTRASVAKYQAKLACEKRVVTTQPLNQK